MMGAGEMLGLITIGCVGVLALVMAKLENELFTLIGYLIMTGIIVGCVWYILDVINKTFFWGGLF